MTAQELISLYWWSIDSDIRSALSKLKEQYSKDKDLIQRAYWSRLQWIAADWANQTGFVNAQIQRGWWTAIEQAQFNNRLKADTAKQIWSAEDDYFSRLYALNKDLQAGTDQYNEFSLNNKATERDKLIEQARLDATTTAATSSGSGTASTGKAGTSTYAPNSTNKKTNTTWTWSWSWTSSDWKTWFETAGKVPVTWSKTAWVNVGNILNGVKNTIGDIAIWAVPWLSVPISLINWYSKYKSLREKYNNLKK